MSTVEVKIGDSVRELESGISVSDAIKAFDRKASKQALAAKVNGEEIDLDRAVEPNGVRPFTRGRNT